jgi:nitrous oxidase accessory protein NosD
MNQRTLVLIAALFVTLVCVAQAQALQTFVAVAGNDANDCTFPTPCRTFAGAVPNTAPGGEITALDSGAYGVVTINKALTLQAAPGAHVSLGDGTAASAVTINAGQSDVIVLRHLHISHSGRPSRGIDFTSGGTAGALHIESCVVTGFPNAGIRFLADDDCDANGCPELFVKDTIVRNNGRGIYFFGGFASLDHCRIEDNTTGVYVATQSRMVTIRDSVIASNSSYGLFSDVLSATTLENCAVTRNGTGIQASGVGAPYNFYGRFFLSNTLIVGNTTGLSPGGGYIVSFGNNRLNANTTNGSFTSTILQQ